jgi:hypothetical protein
MNPMSNRFLVVVRAGDNSLHPQWLTGAEERRWDLLVNYYGDHPTRYADAGPGVVRVDSKGPKWPALHKLFDDTRQAWAAYDYIWIPDDDLAATCADVNLMFDLMAGLDLHLAQPSLSWNSHVSLVMTLHNPNFAVRYSSFVEPMAPCFSRQLLERAVPTFGEIISGWGLDYVWPQLLQNPAAQCAILDRIQVTHTRPVGGPNYEFNRNAGVEPRVEMEALLKKYKVAPMQLSYGAIDRAGQSYSLFGPGGADFVYRLCEGFLGRLADKPELLGNVFAWHSQARRQFLQQAQPAAVATAVAPAPASPGDALERFRAAFQAASRSTAGRVLHATH